jgi:hypothetical protein
VAITGLNLSAASAALKDVYLPVVRDQLNRSNWLLSQIERNTEDFEGNRAVLSLHVGRNPGIGFRADGADLPTAGKQARTTSYVSMRYSYGRIEVTGPTIKTMKSNKGSFVRAVESEMKGVVNDLKRDWSRALFGTSNGVIATTDDTAASTTVVLQAGTSDAAWRTLREGAVIDIGTVASPTSVASARTVSAVDQDAGTFVVSGAAVSTTDGTHFIFRSGSGGTGIETVGLQEIVSQADDNFQGVDTGVYPVWAAGSVVDANGATLTDTLLEESLDEIDVVSGEQPDIIVTTHGVLRNYAASLKDNKRFSNTVTLKGGFKAVSIDTPAGSINVMRDRDVPNGYAFILNTSHLKLFVLSDWEWMDDDGAVLSRVSNKDAYEATFYKYANLATDQRNTHGVITELAD